MRYAAVKRFKAFICGGKQIVCGIVPHQFIIGIKLLK